MWRGEETDFTISLAKLFRQNCAVIFCRRFRFEIAKIVERNELPGHSLERALDPGEPALRMRRTPESDGLEECNRRNTRASLVGMSLLG